VEHAPQEAAVTPSEPRADVAHHASSVALALGALGVVFGDIGTSPLYTLRECLHAAGGATASTDDLLGVLSLIFWSLTMVVTVKYLSFVMRANNHGEGGIFALLAILPRNLRSSHASLTNPDLLAGQPRPPVRLKLVSLLVVIGAALLYGDGAITPAISVLSAIEGLAIAHPAFQPAVVPLTCVILLALFSLQKHGTGAVGALFGPIMLLWFATIAGLGAYHIAHEPSVLAGLSPAYAAGFFARHGWQGIHVLGSVVLAITGGEALYADMGHFGVRPIRRTWLALVMPALVLCYFGQGALVLRDPSAMSHPFFAMVPAGPVTFALVLLSSAATVIASQALISGAFSLTRQAMQLGYFPRVTIRHTARHVEGQIYIPQINWLLAGLCLLLVLGFQRSERLASAYGIAVTGTMVITSLVYYVVVRDAWGWSRARALPLLLLFLTFDIPFFAANALKIVDGGWVPVLIGFAFVTMMLIWHRGRSLVIEQYAERFPRFSEAMPILQAHLRTRVPGTGIFMASSATHVPPILMHFVERCMVLPETSVLLTVTTEGVPTVAPQDRYNFMSLGEGLYRLIVRFGFMEHPVVPTALAEVVAQQGLPIDVDKATYFLGRESLLATQAGQMGRVTESLFAFFSRNAVGADRHFGIPPKQVMEIGVQIDL
jgi:KUP system potassium uptake protein